MVLRRGEKRVKKVLFAKRRDILGGQMGGQNTVFEGVESPPTCTLNCRINAQLCTKIGSNNRALCTLKCAKKCINVPYFASNKRLSAVLSGTYISNLVLRGCLSLFEGIIMVKRKVQHCLGTAPYMYVRKQDTYHSRRMTPMTMAMECIWSRRRVNGE